MKDSESKYKDIIAITDRKSAAVCYNSFEDYISDVVSCKPKAIVLREKDLTDMEYEKLARIVLDIAGAGRVDVILHKYESVAQRLGHRKIHLPLDALMKLKKTDMDFLRKWDAIGTTVHSIEQLEEAHKCGVTYLFAGTIFETACKPGLAGAGLDFLSDICSRTKLPVYAIGGINEERIVQVIQAGAAGGCMMSGFIRDIR
ncbi:MAG: thiamine phosphate synthase [Lachnospira sp.]